MTHQLRMTQSYKWINGKLHQLFYIFESGFWKPEWVLVPAESMEAV